MNRKFWKYYTGYVVIFGALWGMVEAIIVTFHWNFSAGIALMILTMAAGFSLLSTDLEV